MHLHTEVIQNDQGILYKNLSFRAKLTVELVQDNLPATVVIPDHLPFLDVDHVGDVLMSFLPGKCPNDGNLDS